MTARVTTWTCGPLQVALRIFEHWAFHRCVFAFEIVRENNAALLAILVIL